MKCKHRFYKIIAKHYFDNSEIQECRFCKKRRIYGDIIITPWSDNKYISNSQYYFIN